MTREEIFALFAHRQAAWGTRDVDALTAQYADHATVVSPTGGVLEGHEDIERIFRLWMTAFPDLRISREDLLIDGDQAAEVLRITGTHAGEFFGLAPTSRRVEFIGIFLCQLANGLIVSERRVLDFTGVLIQVGVLKARPT